MSRRPTIVLFDIDGTLITTGGVGRQAIELAFGELHGRADACSHFQFDGMTDRAIMRMGLTKIGRDALPKDVDALCEAYLRHLDRTVAGAPPHHYRVCLLYTSRCV